MLERVEADGAWAAAALTAELERHPQLDRRERALATELVYGTLRTRRVLLARLSSHAPRGLGSTDRLVVAHLLLGAYQLLLLDRVPPFAAVDAAVDAIARARGARVAGFANAVLRKVAASGRGLEFHQAVLDSAPSWLARRLAQSVGAEQVPALLGAQERGGPAVAVRLVGDPRLPWLGRAQPGRLCPGARLLRAQGDPRRLAGYAQGAFVVQEEGAQLVALALGVLPGERVLDACAGRGHKASLLAERLGPDGELWVADSHPGKLRLLGEEFGRLGLPQPRAAAVVWTAGPGSVPDRFDRVLVDAPCTGVGTIRRRPEILGRLRPGDPARLGRLAARIARGAAARARPGGRVVFAVCSVLPQECEEAVGQLEDVLEPAPFDAPELLELVDPGATQIRLLPGRHGTDGYFLASFVRRP